MAQQLWLLRHGDAEPGDGDDAARRLSERGERQARSAGAALSRLEVGFGIAFASPRVRALDTAKLVCEPLGLDFVVHEPLSGGFDSRDALELVAGQDGDARVLAVGHEPDLSQVVHDLTGARIDLKKGGIAVMRLEGSRAELVALLRPAELEAMQQ
jgi:phosphohistidine phosphatase